MSRLMPAFNHPLPQMVLTEIGARGEIRTHAYRICNPAPDRLATRAKLSRGLTRIDADRKEQNKKHDSNGSMSFFLIRVYLRSSAADLLERKERFELSNRVWKTRMFPATSLPRAARIKVTRALVVG